MHAHRKSSVSSLLAYPSNAHLPVLTCCSSVIPQECAFPALAAQMAGGSSVRAPPLRLQVSAACLPTAHTQSSDHYRNGPAPSFDETNFQIDPALLPGTPSLAPYPCRSSMRRDGARLLRFRPSVPRRMQRGVLRSCPWWHRTPAASRGPRNDERQKPVTPDHPSGRVFFAMFRGPLSSIRTLILYRIHERVVGCDGRLILAPLNVLWERYYLDQHGEQQPCRSRPPSGCQ